MEKNDLLTVVKRHAERNYEKGWDLVLECYDDAEIVAAIGNARTERGAIANVSKALSLNLRFERYREVRSTVW